MPFAFGEGSQYKRKEPRRDTSPDRSPFMESMKFKAQSAPYRAKEYVKREGKAIGSKSMNIVKEKSKSFVSVHSHLQSAAASLSGGGTLGRANAAAVGFKARLERANAPRGDKRFQ